MWCSWLAADASLQLDTQNAAVAGQGSDWRMTDEVPTTPTTVGSAGYASEQQCQNAYSNAGITE